jgi:hypothetical protein
MKESVLCGPRACSVVQEGVAQGTETPPGAGAGAKNPAVAQPCCVAADATGRDQVCGWLSVGCHVSGGSGIETGSGVGLVTSAPNGHLPVLHGLVSVL